MNHYSKKIDIRWSDIDANFHLRHSVYYDLGAFLRMSFLTENGLSAAAMQQEHIGPILFREESVFKKEIHFSDHIEMNVQLVKSTEDMGRWTMRHEIRKNGETLCALITIDGAWMDTRIRKLAVPPEHFREVFKQLPRSADFEWTIK